MLETVLVVGLIAAAAAYLCTGFLRKRHRKPTGKSCGGGCGCSKEIRR